MKRYSKFAPFFFLILFSIAVQLYVLFPRAVTYTIRNNVLEVRNGNLKEIYVFLDGKKVGVRRKSIKRVELDGAKRVMGHCNEILR